MPTRIESGGGVAYGDVTAYLEPHPVAGQPPTIHLSKAGLPWRVSVTLRPVDGVPRITSLSLDRDPANWILGQGGSGIIDKKALRELPLDDFERVATAMLAAHAIEGQSTVVPHGRRGPKGPSDDELRLVADIYNGDQTGSPTVAVGEALHLSPRTASRWVSAARSRGFLPPYQQEEN